MDFSIQRQIANTWTVEAAYVGRLGKRLLQNLDLATPLDLVDPKSGMDYFKASAADVGGERWLACRPLR